MDVFTREKRSEIMSKIKSESGIEILPERLSGLYLRKHQRGIFGNPDFANKAKKLAVFIDGCFWHGCPRHYRRPKSNRGYWREKIRKNRGRDRLVRARLKADGWMVARIWEHDLQRGPKSQKMTHQLSSVKNLSS